MVTGLFPADFFPASLFPINFSPLGLLPADLFLVRSFSRQYFFLFTKGNQPMAAN